MSNLTERRVRTFKKKSTWDVRWDKKMAGFGCRIYPSGKKAFVIRYNHNNRKYLYTIGSVEKISLKQARKIAKNLFGEISLGINPLIRKKEVKRKKIYNVKYAFNEFIEKYAKKRNRTWAEYKRIFEKDVFPLIGSKSIDEVTREDIFFIIDNVSKRSADTMVNRTFSYMRSFFNWSLSRNILKSSPMAYMKLPYPKKQRDRVLKDTEIKEIWNASYQIGYPFGDIIRMLFLTGQRRGEVASMVRSEFDIESGIWTIPKEKTKSKRENYIFITRMGRDILNKASSIGDYYFSSAGNRAFENFSRDKRKLDKIVKIDDWRIHDIRRTTASGMARLGISPYVIERILNHSDGIISGVAAVYNRYKYEKEVKDALEKWSDYLEEILVGE